MTYWQSGGYIRAVFPAMARLAQYKTGSVLSQVFPEDGKKPKGKKRTVDEMVEMGLFGRGEDS